MDTFRASVARMAVEEGANIINDVSGGADPDMFATAASLKVPYVLMHMRGTSENMQELTDYKDVATDVVCELSGKLAQLHQAGVADVIIDPGFGFAKTMEQNYELLGGLEAFGILGCPVLVGVSRKSMLTKLLDIDTADALVPTAVAGAFALDHGAAILRVHDVRAARQTIQIFNAIKA